MHPTGSTSTPTTTGYTITELDCFGEPLASIVPFLALDAGTSAAISNDFIASTSANAENLFKWYLSSADTFYTEWQNPTALQIINNATTYNDSSRVIEVPTAGEWTYVIIESALAIPHPIHLHGHGKPRSSRRNSRIPPITSTDLKPHQTSTS